MHEQQDLEETRLHTGLFAVISIPPDVACPEIHTQRASQPKPAQPCRSSVPREEAKRWKRRQDTANYSRKYASSVSREAGSSKNSRTSSSCSLALQNVWASILGITTTSPAKASFSVGPRVNRAVPLRTWKVSSCQRWRCGGGASDEFAPRWGNPSSVASRAETAGGRRLSTRYRSVGCLNSAAERAQSRVILSKCEMGVLGTRRARKESIVLWLLGESHQGWVVSMSLR